MNVPPQGVMFPMGSLYVGDLHPDVTEAMLYEKFSSAGQVLSLRICRDARTKQSLGYGYVNFNNPQDAERALDTMNFDCLKGKPMRIMWCQRDPSLRKSGVGNVFIKNLDKNIDNKAMYDTFSAFGNILSCKVALDENGCSKGYGFVHFESEEIANRAIEKVNGMLLNMKKVYVGKFVPRAEREKQLGERARRFTNVFVKNFGNGIDEQRLRSEFSRFGTITSAYVARDRDGTPRGFGFVAFAEALSAEKAVQEMDGKEVDGRVWYVGRAQKKAERANELRRKHEQLRLERFSKLQAVNVYVKNLDDAFDDERLRQEFGQFGSITSAKVMTENGRSRGFGFVCFSAPDEASKAIQDMNGKIVGSKPLYAALAQRREARRALLNAQYAQRAAALRQHQQAALPFAPAAPPPPFLLPAVQAAAPAPARFFGHLAAGPPPPNAQALRAAPRWPQPALRPNGAYLPLPFRGGAAPSGGGAGGAARAPPRARPITGAGGGQQPAARPNSKFTQHAAAPTGRVSGVVQAQQSGNGGDSKEQAVSVTVAAPAEQKQLIGEQLFRIVEKLHPEMAGKITGMLLEIDNTELVHMIKNQESLRAKVEEAIAVLEAHKAGAAAAGAAQSAAAAAAAAASKQGALVVQE